MDNVIALLAPYLPVIEADETGDIEWVVTELLEVLSSEEADYLFDNWDNLIFGDEADG